MSRFWNEFTGLVIDVIGVFWFVIGVLVIAAAIGLLWHFYPRWVPRFGRWRASDKPERRRRRRFRKLRRPRFRRRAKDSPIAEQFPLAPGPDLLPDMAADLLRSRADAYATDGRFAEAVRERLRAIVRELVDGGVIPHHPDWTITELAGAAAVVEPALRPALSGASTIFSDIWYGQRPADQGSDQGMRVHDSAVRTIVDSRSGVAR
jgi:hypothetical protein